LRIILQFFSRWHFQYIKRNILVIDDKLTDAVIVKYLPETERETALRLLLYYAGVEDGYSGYYKEYYLLGYSSVKLSGSFPMFLRNVGGLLPDYTAIYPTG
jgi:hypothetical protein